MIISLDFDDTYTRDPDLWSLFIKQAINSGHVVYGITMRYPNEGFGELFEKYSSDLNGNVIFTSREGKEDHMWKNYNVVVDVWIDDSPIFVLQDALR